MKTPILLPLFLFTTCVAVVISGCGKGEKDEPATASEDEQSNQPQLIAGLARCECQEPLGDAAALEEDLFPPFSEREIRQVQRDAREVVVLDEIPLQVFFGNLHSHTSYSDGSSEPEAAYTHAREVAGLDFLAITEHNHGSAGTQNGKRIAFHHDRYKGPRMDGLIPVADNLTIDGEFVALYGQEGSSISKGNHYCAFDVPEVIDEDDVPNGEFDTLLEDFLPANLDSFGDQALLQLNHPWNSNCPNSREYGRDDFASFTQWRSILDARAQLIEVINGPSHSSGENLHPATVADFEFRRYLNLGFHLAPTANQDNHFETWGTITNARTGVIAESLTKANVMGALKERHCYASLDKNLRIVARVEDELIGSIVAKPQNGSDVDVKITLHDDDEDSGDYWVEVFADEIGGDSNGERADLVATYGPLEFSSDPNAVNEWTLPDLEYEGWDYIYFKIQQGPSGSEKEQAWLAPVWFE